MINKAPKDMTATEFVEYFKEKKQVPSYGCNIKETYDFMVKMLSEPAPNPFTPDQVAWMRIMQEMKFFYAVAGSDGSICLTEQKPVRDNNKNWLVSASYYTWFRKGIFLENYISFDDPEPLCFADYAPLEEK